MNIFIKECIKECILAFGESMGKGSNTPSKHNIFTVGNSELLSQDKSENLYHIVAKFLYVYKRTKVDISLAVPYLCTRLSCSTEEDWETLRRSLHYLQSTLDLPSIIGANFLDMVHAW